MPELGMWEATSQGVVPQWVSDLDSALVLPSASCESLRETSLVQLGLSVFIHGMGTMPSLLQGSQSCGEAMKDMRLKQLLGI